MKNKGSRSPIRIVYAFHTDALKVVFLEIYSKQDRPNADDDLIDRYLKAECP